MKRPLKKNLMKNHPGRYRRYGGQRGNDYDDGDTSGFRLKVDIPYFGSLGIEDFLDWVADVDRFFDYTATPAERRVRLVACRLKGMASAWW